MGVDAAIGSSAVKVRSGLVQREVSRAAVAASVYMVASAVAPPRLWRWVTDEVCVAFDRAVDGKPASPTLVTEAVAAAANAIESIRGQLIEPDLTVDAQLGLLVATPGAVHVALSSGVRLYRARRGVPERLWPQRKRPAGVASRELEPASEPVEPGDLFVLGTRDTFTVRAIGNLATALARSNVTPARELCDAVVGPCREGGVGAAAVVVRAT